MANRVFQRTVTRAENRPRQLEEEDSKDQFLPVHKGEEDPRISDLRHDQ